MNAPSILAQPPIWRESRLGLEMAALVRSPVYRGEGVADAAGQPVFLIPGFLAGDNSLGLMTRWLRRTGHRTRRAGIRVNADCASAAIVRLEERLETVAARSGTRVAVIGQSRGGTFAKVLAVRRPDLVSGIVTLGSPVREQLAVHPLVRAQVLLVGALGSLGAPGLFRRSCLWGECCTAFLKDLQAASLPAGVGYLGIYSRGDGIVDWRSCLDPAADELLEVDASHCGMGADADAYRAIAAALTRWRETDAGGRTLKRAA